MRLAPSLTALAVALATVSGFVGGWRTRRRREEDRWFEMSNDLLVEASLDGYFVRVGDQWQECLGWTREELMAIPFRELVHPDDLAATNVHADSLDRAPGEVKGFENRYLAKDGSWRWLLWNARSDGHKKYAVAKDITERKRLEAEREMVLSRVEAMARTDALTGLPNRRSWDEELARAIARAERHGYPLALAMIDMDDFKAFNDAEGHAAGDEMLAEAASRWRLSLRVTDFLARYGGEEFAVLLPDCAPEEAADLLDRLRQSTPGEQTCSVGIAFWQPGDDSGELLTRADAALYRAKGMGRDQVVAAR